MAAVAEVSDAIANSIGLQDFYDKSDNNICSSKISKEELDQIDELISEQSLEMEKILEGKQNEIKGLLKQEPINGTRISKHESHIVR